MKMCFSLTLIGFTILAAGCNSSAVVDGPSEESSESNSEYLVDREPAGAIPVGEARESTEDGQDVTLVGLIGGSKDPFVDGLAAFTIVDPKVPYCAPDEGCPTPWDYCCKQDQVKDNIATVKIVDASGRLVAQGARGLLGVKELSTVVVQGKTERDDQGNLTVSANQVFVRPGQ